MTSSLNPLYQLRRLYDWTMKWAQHPKGTWALSILSATEGIFCPIPIDPFLIAMGASRPRKALFYAMVASVSSVVGGTIGYFLGLWFWDSTKDFLFEFVFTIENFKEVTQLFTDNPFWAVFVAGFTPIPYKVFAIAAGVANINLGVFVVASLISRSLRFLLIGGLLYVWGPQIRVFIERYFEKLTIGFTLVLIVFYIIYRNL